MAKAKAVAEEKGAEKFMLLPVLVLILAQMGTSGDNGALSLAATALTQDLGATTADIQLANMVYSLMAGAFMIAGGMMGTIIGWKKNFRMGALLCAAGEVVLAVSPNMTVFIWGGRTLVGFGASFMIPSVLGLVPKIYHGKNRVLAFGCIGAASGLSALLPLLLSIVLMAAGMRVTFFVLAAYFVLVFLLSFKLPEIEQSDEKLKFDGVGVALAATGLFLFLVGVSRISAWGLVEPFPACPFTIAGISPCLPMAVLGVIILIVMINVEKKVEEKNGFALLPQSFLKTPQVLAGLAASAITFFFMGVQSILMAPYLQLVAGWSPAIVGVLSIVVGVPTFAFSIGIPKFMPKANPRRVIQVGYLTLAAALIIMAFSVTLDAASMPGILIGCVVAGSGAGIVSAQANNVVALAVNERDASQSGGIQTTMRNVGQAIGIALLGAVLLFGITNSVKDAAANDSRISESTVAAISERNIDLVSDENFRASIEDIDMSDEERDALVEINAQSRFNSTRFAYYVGAAIIVLGLATTPAIKKFSKEEEKVMKKLYFNGDFVPMTGEGDTFEALLVADDGTIAFTGSLEEARAQAEDAEEIDLNGACLMPGLIDPHSHISGCTQYIVAADLNGAADFDEIVERLAAFAEQRGIGEDGVIMGVSYDQNSLAEHEHPNRHVLDRVSETIPVIAVHASSHMVVANTKLLELAGITAETPDPEGARYGREADGTPDGYCEEPGAMWPVFAVIQPRQKMDMDVMIGEMQDIYLENGITTCQEGATTADFAALFCGLANKGLLKMDVVSYPMYGEDVDKILADHEPFVSQDYTGHFRIGGLKMFFDGSPQGRTAWMTEPYTPGDEGEGYCGYGTMTDKAAYDFMRKAIDGNHQLLAHTNGDAAADQYLRVYKRALEDSPNPDKASLHPVMIHCQTARRDQYEQMAEINMIPSIFASHIWYWADVHLKNFGPVRGGRVSACHDALECGLPFTFHTDTPVLRPNFFEAVWCAAKRVTKGGAQLDENQKISVYEGLKAITVNGAFQYGELDRKGTLEAGKLADFCIVEKNPLKIELDEVRNLRVLETVKEGETVWTRK